MITSFTIRDTYDTCDTTNKLEIFINYVNSINYLHVFISKRYAPATNKLNKSVIKLWQYNTPFLVHIWEPTQRNE